MASFDFTRTTPWIFRVQPQANPLNLNRSNTTWSLQVPTRNPLLKQTIGDSWRILYLITTLGPAQRLQRRAFQMLKNQQMVSSDAPPVGTISSSDENIGFIQLVSSVALRDSSWQRHHQFFPVLAASWEKRSNLRPWTPVRHQQPCPGVPG